jgi:hypothetical protein
MVAEFTPLVFQGMLIFWQLVQQPDTFRQKTIDRREPGEGRYGVL